MIIDTNIPKTFDSFLYGRITGCKKREAFADWMLEQILEDPRYERRMRRKYPEVYRLWNSYWAENSEITKEFKRKFQAIIRKEPVWKI